MDDNNIIKSTDEEAVEEVVEGEVEETPATFDSGTSKGGNNNATVTLSLENLIRGHLGTLEKLRVQIAEHSDTLNNILENDATFKEHAEAAKKATKIKTGTKSEIMKRPDVMQVSSKMKAAREEMKEQQMTLSELLAEYQRTTGLDSIEMEDGKIKKIVMTAKLVS